MIDKNTPYLCGGIFFVLLLQARLRSKIRDNYCGDTDGLSDVNLMHGLVKVVSPNQPDPYDKTFKKNTSEYKSCLFEGGDYIPFKKKLVIDRFNSDVQNKYTDTLTRMTGFIDVFVGTASCEWLVKALLEVLETDTAITDSDEFYIYRNGHTATKAEIVTLSDIEFQPFLLGILHYIIMNRKDNKSGRATYEAWHKMPPEERAAWEFDSNIGTSITRPLKISLICMQPKSNSETEPDNEEIPEVEILEDDAADTASAQVINQYISNPTIINQNGEKNIHIDHVGTINF